MIFMYFLAPFDLQNFKKSLEWIWNFEDTLQFWVQNGTFTTTTWFFRKNH